MRYIIGLFITIALIILLIIILVSGGGNGSSNTQKVPMTNKLLESYASTPAQAVYTVDGPVNAQQEHVQVRIIVSKDQVTYQKLSGYDGTVTDTRGFANTQAAFSEFLKSLSHAGFTRGDTSKANQDEQGYCPTGNRYVFELNQGSQRIERFWATSCGNPRTYKGNLSLTSTLFVRQVPGFDSLDTGLSL